MGKMRLLERIAVKGEVKIMRRLADAGGHRGIVAVKDVVETESGSKGGLMHLVMEACGGGSLLELLRRNGPLPEDAARMLLCQLADSLSFCHARGVLHRDIKPDNVLLDKPADSLYSPSSAQGPNSSACNVLAKLADFGLACTLAEDGSTSGLAGSAHFIAPEMLRGERYKTTADVWSLGVLLCTMLTAKLPFSGQTEDDEEGLRSAILGGKVNFGLPAWEGVSVQAKDLVMWMLQLDPKARPEARDILDHEWCTEAGAATQAPHPALLEDLESSFERLVDMQPDALSPVFSTYAAQVALCVFPALPVGPASLPPCKGGGAEWGGSSSNSNGGYEDFEATASLWCLEHLDGNGIGCVACAASQPHIEMEGPEAWVAPAVDAF